MTAIPKLYDDFSTSPLTDPLYKFDGTWSYNGTLDQLETTTTNTSIEVLNSQNPYGIVVANMNVNTTNASQGQNKGYVRAFGYYFVFMRFHTYILDDNDLQWLSHSDGSLYGYSTNTTTIVYRPYYNLVGTRHGFDMEIKIVSTPTGVEFYCNGSLDYVLPHKSNIKNVKIGTGGNESTQFNLYDISIKADSSLPQESVILEPSEAGSINAAQEVSFTVPASRLFVDLGSYAPGITDLANVVYDPGGANVSMSKDTGIPDRAGGTTGDYYLEIPSNGVAYDYRLVIKEAFVIANSVVTTDSIDFDVTGGPSGQTGTVTEEDDLDCYVQVSQESSMVAGDASLSNFGIYPLFHNFNADGNQTNLQNSSLVTFFDGDGGAGLSYNSSVSFPIIFDLDLGKVFPIKRINALNSSGDTVHLTGWDLYSNTVPFSGASLGQGTLEFTNYPIAVTSANPGAFAFPYQFPTQLPTLGFSTRYLRLVVPNSSYFNTSLGSANFIIYEMVLVVEDFQSINSIDDNAQFEFDSGGGFGAFPGGGVTQGSGIVRATLTAPLQLGSGDRKFIAVQFRADLTD